LRLFKFSSRPLCRMSVRKTREHGLAGAGLPNGLSILWRVDCGSLFHIAFVEDREGCLSIRFFSPCRVHPVLLRI